MTAGAGEPDYIALADGSRIAYHHRGGESPGVLFCAGFNSNMQGTKALALEALCTQHGRQFTRFDYQGHGESTGKFEDGTIGLWLDDALRILDEVCQGPQVIVGSSMGGWIMLLMTLYRPDRVAGLVGIATAADFTDALSSRGLDERQLRELAATGYCEIPNCYDDQQPYRIARQLLEEGRKHSLLGGQIAIDVPVRLIQGQRDEDVPWENALTIMAKLRSKDVELQLLKAGDHRLSSDADLTRLTRTLQALLEQLKSGPELV